jgi:predicted Zn-dependent protease
MSRKLGALVAALVTLAAVGASGGPVHAAGTRVPSSGTGAVASAAPAPAPAASPAAAAPGFVTFVSKDWGFSIDYPMDWAIDSSKEAQFAWTAPAGDAQVGVVVQQLPKGTTLDDFMNAFVKTAGGDKQVGNLTVQSSTLSGYDARTVGYTLTNASGVAAVQVVEFLITDNWAYAIVATALADVWGNYADTFNTAEASFTVL